jgi:hypothetical protein
VLTHVLSRFSCFNSHVSIAQKKIPQGGTIASVSIFTDETHLTNFAGGKKAHPVYATINNIEKSFRRKISSGCHVLIGYLPVPKYQVFCKVSRKPACQQFFHDCMREIVRPLEKAGKDGVEMTCADGFVRSVFPILACYIADAPEQARVTCTKENQCPKCPVAANERGKQLFPDHTGRIPLREVCRTRTVLGIVNATGVRTNTFKREGLRECRPFWADLPHTNIFMAITPDILHQLHNGVIGEHLIPWLQEIIEDLDEDALDNRFQAQSPFPGLRRFRDGISAILQWTGNKRREMEKILISCLIGLVDNQVISATSALLELTYLMRYQSHNDDSLNTMQAAIDCFHANKEVFMELGIREDFNFQKMHAIQHFIDSIRLFGSADGYSTEISEWLHIDLAKNAYQATNQRNHTAQMAAWLHRREKVAYFAAYLRWCNANKHVDQTNTGDSDDNNELDSDTIHDPPNPRAVVGPFSTFEIAQKPASQNVLVETLESDSAPQFLEELAIFLNDTTPDGTAVVEPRDTDTFHLYPQIQLLVPGNPQTGSNRVVERIRAVPARQSALGQTTTPAAFGVALVHAPARNSATEGTPLQSELIRTP